MPGRVARKVELTDAGKFFYAQVGAMKRNYSSAWVLLVAVFFLAACGGMKPKRGGGGKKKNNVAENRRQDELQEENDELRRLLEQANIDHGLQTSPNAFGSSPLRPGDIEDAQRAGAFRDANGQLSTVGANNNFANANVAQTQDFEPLPALQEQTEIKRALLSNPTAHSGGRGGTPIQRRRVD